MANHSQQLGSSMTLCCEVIKRGCMNSYILCNDYTVVYSKSTIYFVLCASRVYRGLYFALYRCQKTLEVLTMITTRDLNKLHNTNRPIRRHRCPPEAAYEQL